MKFRAWTVDGLIEHLHKIKASDLLDYHCVPMCFGEIHFYNGKDKCTGDLPATIDEIMDSTEG